MRKKLTNCGALLLVALLINTEQVKGQGAPVNMSWIPPGNFVMGDTFGEGYQSEFPTHTVYVTGFYIDKYEVTKALWYEVYNWAITHGYSFDNTGSGKALNHPVYTMNWYDAVKWCNARSEKENRTPAYYTDAGLSVKYRSGQITPYINWNIGYRLPTEAEWEKAARGGTSGHRFPWSDVDTITQNRANYWSLVSLYGYDISSTRGYHPIFNDGIQPYTSPVGYFAPNGYGLYDMAGNVWEWCWDWYGPYPSSSQTDPRGPSSGSLRAFRGGSCFDLPVYSRIADRNFANPSFTGNGYGCRSVLLAPLPYETTEVLNTPSTQQVYSCSITRQPGKDSLVIVTHGWIRKEIGQTSPPNPDWVDDMANLIRANIASQGLNNWQVETFKWKEKAWMKWPLVVAGVVLDNGEKEGGNLGDCVGSQGWSHIHLIGHSAGAAVIQAATLNIKCANINTVVHTTFLDPYVGLSYGGRSRYGLVADWADNYFSYDTETFDDIAEPTAGRLDHAYNVEVTWLDANKVPIDAYSSTPGGGIGACYQTVSSHAWPHIFYANTIPPSVQSSSQGFGFPFSKEGGNWNFALANYRIYTDPIRVLGTPDAPCFTINGADPLHPLWLMNFNQTPSVTSTTGLIENNGSLFILSSTEASQLPQLRQSRASTADASGTSTPAWLATVLTVTNKINSVSFDAQFTSTNGAEGILSVYWNTNSLGTVDERVVVPGLRHYTYSLSQTVTNEIHTLGFRLDSFTSAISSVTVTNIALSFVGIPNPFSLSFTGKDANGCSLFRLTGPSGFNYSVEASTNLIDWQTIAVLINTNGTVPFVDRQSTNSTARFYRAVGY